MDPDVLERREKKKKRKRQNPYNTQKADALATSMHSRILEVKI